MANIIVAEIPEEAGPEYFQCREDHKQVVIFANRRNIFWADMDSSAPIDCIDVQSESGQVGQQQLIESINNAFTMSR